MHLKIANNKIEGWADLENKCPEEMTARHVYSVTINFFPPLIQSRRLQGMWKKKNEEMKLEGIWRAQAQ